MFIKKLFFLALGILSFLLFLSNSLQAQKNAITFKTLLKEIIVYDQIARYPESDYRLKQQSSYNRESKTPDDKESWHANGDNRYFIRIEKNKDREEYVLMEHEGPGVMGRIWIPNRNISPSVHLGRARSNVDHGIIRIYLDGNPEPVIEGDPIRLFNGTLLATYPFGHQSLSSAVSFLPFLWAKSCKITVDEPPVYYIFTYRAYQDDVKIKTLTKNDLKKAAHKITKVGKTLVNPDYKKGKGKRVKQVLEAGDHVSLDFSKEEHAIRNLVVKLGNYENPQVTRSMILKIEFDGQETVWCPVGDFFGTGVGLHPFKGWYRTVDENGRMSSRWVMPYKNSARVSLVNLHDESMDVEMEVKVGSWKWDDRSMYFHGNWKADYNVSTRPRSDWNYITLQGKGVYVGDVLTVWNPRKRWWGEGDAKIWVDGESFPSIFGTGTEDYYAYSWGGTNRNFYEHPFHAQVRVNDIDKNNPKVPYVHDTQGYSTETRTRAIDCMPFDKSLKLDMEVWHTEECKMDYTVATYWYAFPETKSDIVPMPKEAIRKVKTIE